MLAQFASMTLWHSDIDQLTLCGSVEKEVAVPWGHKSGILMEMSRHSPFTGWGLDFQPIPAHTVCITTLAPRPTLTSAPPSTSQLFFHLYLLASCSFFSSCSSCPSLLPLFILLIFFYSTPCPFFPYSSDLSPAVSQSYYYSLIFYRGGDRALP